MSDLGRKFSGRDYRYEFNGMENDNEIKGEGNSVDLMDGLQPKYDMNGQIVWECNYSLSKKHGLEILYKKDKKIMEINY